MEQATPLLSSETRRRWLYLGFLAVVLFLAAGRLDWPMGWGSMGIYAAISATTFFLVDPALVEERSRVRAGVKGRDALLAGLSFLFFFPITLTVAGLDWGRLGWSPSLPIAVRLAALALFAPPEGFPRPIMSGLTAGVTFAATLAVAVVAAVAPALRVRRIEISAALRAAG